MNIEVKTGVYTQIKDGVENNIEFHFTLNLSAKNKMKFVNSVTDLLVTNNYNGIIKDMIFDYEIIDIFTDVDITEIREAADAITAIEDLLDTTNIVDIVVANVDTKLIDSLRQAVDENIEYKTGIKQNTLNTSLSHLINAIEKKIEGIDIDGMMNFASAISGISGELTPEKILEVYSNTDMFKNNRAEREKIRKEHIEKITQIATKRE